MAISVSYEEQAGSPIEVKGIVGLIAERKLLCDWGDRDTLCTEILQNPNNVYPYHTSTWGALAISAKAEPLGQVTDRSGYTTDMVTYPKAVVTVKYSTIGLEYDGSLTYPYIREELSTWANPLRVKGTGLVWETGGGWIDEEETFPGIVETGLTWQYTHLWMANIPSAILALAGGCCNNAAVTSPTLAVTFDAETLYYAGMTATRSIDQQGASAWNITHFIKWKKSGWNTWYRPLTNQYEKIYVGATQIKPYTPVSFSVLF